MNWSWQNKLDYEHIMTLLLFGNSWFGYFYWIRTQFTSEEINTNLLGQRIWEVCFHPCLEGLGPIPPTGSIAPVWAENRYRKRNSFPSERDDREIKIVDQTTRMFWWLFPVWPVVNDPPRKNLTLSMCLTWIRISFHFQEIQKALTDVFISIICHPE